MGTWRMVHIISASVKVVLQTTKQDSMSFGINWLNVQDIAMTICQTAFRAGDFLDVGVISGNVFSCFLTFASLTYHLMGNTYSCIFSQ